MANYKKSNQVSLVSRGETETQLRTDSTGRLTNRVPYSRSVINRTKQTAGIKGW